MASCYRIAFTSRFGPGFAFKWGDTPVEALARLKRARDIPGLGATEYEAPVLDHPQPFADSPPAVPFDIRPPSIPRP